jgi:hypothetical protein
MNHAGRILGAAIGLAAADASADPLGHVKFGVTLEGYYEYNTNRPHDRVNDLRAYDTRSNSFGIQQLAVVLESPVDVAAGRRWGLRADFQFGQATETVQGNPANEPRPEVYRNLWQVYGTYVFPVGRGLQMDFGKFASNLGYETNYAKDNSQFSRAYLFHFLPFYHSGLRLSLPVSDSATLMYMLTNGIQQTEDFNDSPSQHVSAVIRPNEKLSWTTSYFFGKEQVDRTFRVADTYVSWTMAQRLAVGIDVNYTTLDGDPALSLFGVGAYARWQASDASALSFRYERLDDEGLFGGVDQVLQEATATFEYRFADGFLLRGELRHDASSEPFFTGPVPDDLRDHQDTILVGAVWWFGNKQGAW